MSQVLRFTGVVRRDPAIEAWMSEHRGALGTIARRWFDVMRACGDDVREVLHDGHPTACIVDAGFAYVNAFRAHVNVGFFRGAELADPAGLLEGTGKYMRHVKLRPDSEVDAAALSEANAGALGEVGAGALSEVDAATLSHVDAAALGELIEAAYVDMRRRVAAP